MPKDEKRCLLDAITNICFEVEHPALSKRREQWFDIVVLTEFCEMPDPKITQQMV